MADAMDGPFLLVEGGPNNSEQIRLGAGLISMGRQSANEVVVAEAGVSRRHAEILQKEESYYLRDLASTNGTFVNTRKIPQGDYLLHDGDRITLGATKVVFIFRSPTANTLQITLANEAVKDPETGATWIGEAINPDQVPDDNQGANPSNPMKTPPQAPLAAPEEPEQEDVYEGTVRLHIKVDGGTMAQVVNFTQLLRQKPEFRLLRLSNNKDGGVDIWLGLRQPVPLRRMLSDMEIVASVSPTLGRDLSPASQDAPLTVILRIDTLHKP